MARSDISELHKIVVRNTNGCIGSNGATAGEGLSIPEKGDL